MSATTMREIAIEPIIHYPQTAEPGKSYLMTVDLHPVQDDPATWPYEREEYVINCHVNTGDLFTVQPLGDATVILHRFGGTYGPARFVLTAIEGNKIGTIRISLINGWGVPLDTIELSQIKVAMAQQYVQPEKAVSSITVLTSNSTLQPHSPEQQPALINSFVEWQTQVKTKLHILAANLHDFTPNIIYGALAAAVIFPLIETARQAIRTQNYPMLMTLGTLAASIGGNPVAEQIRRWHDRTEEELAIELAQQATINETWRNALDDLLERFDALRLVQTVMSETDKDWFAQTLKTALEEVGSRLTIHMGNVTGNIGVAVGEQITQIINYYHPPQPTGAPTVDEAMLKAEIRTYLDWVCRHYGQVTLRGIRRQGEQAMTLALDTIYVPLIATALPRDERDLSASRNPNRSGTLETQEHAIKLNELLAQGDRVIVTGGPGSGKTMVLQHLAYTLARALLDNNLPLAQQKVGLSTDVTEVPIPIVLPLSAYAIHRRQTSQPRTLAAFIVDYLVKQQEDESDLLPDFFTRLLYNGRHLILLLDGLDEVPDEAERARIREVIESLATGRVDLRLVLTCRSAAYQGHTALGRDFREVHVQSLDEAHVTALIQQAYSALYHDDAVVRARQIDELLTSIRELEADRHRLGEDVARLIDSPLMVRLLLIVHLSERRFPQHRAELYQRATDSLLWPDYGLEDSEALEEIHRWVGQSHEVHRDLVQQLAWELHRLGNERGREIEEATLHRLLRSAGQPPELVSRFLQLTRLRGTLLEERFGLYRFSNLAFQEFMVARYLAETVRGEGGVEAIIRLLQEEKLILESWWREPILLVASYLSMNARRNAETFLLQLAEVGQKSTLSSDQQLAAAELAATGCLEWFGKKAYSSLYYNLTSRLTGLIADTDLMNKVTPRLRAAAGIALGNLGDPRRGVGVRGELPNIEWRLVKAGPFIMGSAKERDRYADSSEVPQFSYDLLLQPYQISRYPITIAQYQTFVDAGGYTEMSYWTVEGWIWRTKRQVTHPQNYGALSNVPNYPQVGISWYEAVAFCSWLSKRMGMLIRLPTEPEWERAARHNDGRLYPWGNEPDLAQNCNMAETGLGSVSTVGIFPTGSAICGAADMAGNVSEWTLSQWQSDKDSAPYLYPYDPNDGREEMKQGGYRVVRGGSYRDDRHGIRCAGRSGRESAQQFNDVGFRVITVGQDIINANIANEEGKTSAGSSISHHSNLIREIQTLASGQATQRLAELLSRYLSNEEQHLIQELLLALDASVIHNALITALQMSDEGRHNATALFTNSANMRIWQKLQGAIAADPTINLHGELYDLFANNTNNHPFLLERHAQYFVRAIEPTRAEQTAALNTVNELHEKLTKINALEKAYFRTEPFGSQVRNTAIRPLSDIDALVIFRINPQLEGPQAAHQILEEALRQIYRKQTIINRAATGKFKPRGSSFGASFLIQLPHIWLEAIPAVYARDETKRILVPDRHLRRWVSTNHEIHAQHAQQQDVQTEGIYSNLIKAVKWWHYRKSPWRRFLTGFMLECLIADNLDILDTSLLGSFGRLMQRIQERYRSVGSMSRFPEPGVSKGFKYTSLEPSEFKRFVNLVDLTVEQIQAISPSDSLVEKIERWQQVFGTEFPTTVVSDTVGKE